MGALLAPAGLKPSAMPPSKWPRGGDDDHHGPLGHPPQPRLLVLQTARLATSGVAHPPVEPPLVGSLENEEGPRFPEALLESDNQLSEA